MAQCEHEYGRIFKLDLLFGGAVIVTDPDDVARLLKVERLEKNTAAYDILQKLTADTHPNFLTEHMGPYYKALRKAVTPAFSSANLRQFLPVLLELTDRVSLYLTANGESMAVDIDQATQRLTVDVIGRFAFDRDFGATSFSGSQNEALAAIKQLMCALQKMTNPFNKWFWWRKEARDAWATRCRFHKLVAAALEDLREKPPAPHCLLAYLLNMTDPETGKPLSAKRLRCEIAVIWMAGFETTAHAMTWALMYMASDPKVQDRVAQELDAAGLLATPSRPQPRPVAWSDLGALHYLNAVIYEALRLMTPAPGGTVRMNSRDIQVAGYEIPKDTMIWIHVYSMMRSTRVWGPDATQFRPERWLAGGSRAAATSGAAVGSAGDPAAAPNGTSGGGRDGGCDGGGAAVTSTAEVDEVVKAAATQTARGWMPFSEGPRNCVGQSLAMMELRVALATWCGRFSFRLADEMGGTEGAIAESRLELSLKPGPKGLLVHVTPRVPS